MLLEDENSKLSLKIAENSQIDSKSTPINVHQLVLAEFRNIIPLLAEFRWKIRAHFWRTVPAKFSVAASSSHTAAQEDEIYR